MEKEESKLEFIKWFSELDKNSISVAGGKGANLSEIYNLKIPVPPGFVITTVAYDHFIDKAGIREKIHELLGKINYEDTKQLDETTKEIRALIVSSEVPKEMEEEIVEAYENLGTDVSEGKSAHDLIEDSSDSIFVAVRSSATSEDLVDASFAGQQESFLNVKGNLKLIEKMKECFASLFTSRATYYRQKKGFKHEDSKLSVVVQKMIDSDKSGVVLSKDPSYQNDNTIIESVFGLGEGIVLGKITPDRFIISKDLEIIDKKISDKEIAIIRNPDGENVQIKLPEDKSKLQSLKDYEVKKLAEIGLKLEKHYGKPQDIEFAIGENDIYIVQTRAITTMKSRVGGKTELKGEVVVKGLAASPGISSGKIKIVKDLKDLDKVKEGDVLVTKMTNPDMVVVMKRAAAIVTDEGGLTSHAAIVSREMGIPSVVGTDDATIKLKEGEIITVNGFTGNVFKGKVSETIIKEVLPVTAKTKTDIKINVDLPQAAERASKTNVRGVGLLRIEGIIAESGKHPDYFLKNKNLQDYEEIIFKGISAISKYFDKLWVRTSDVRTDEFQNLEGAPKEVEVNPMLGMHGIRYSLKHPEVLKSEIKALSKVAEKGKKIGMMMPQIISLDEVKKVKEILKELNIGNVKLGIMVETPASVQMIKEFCQEGIDFISFGTNDLTQYTLAIDRGNEQVQEIYDELNPAVLKQIEYVIRVCKRNNIETSICGQAANKKKMVKFLVEVGIDSLSVNPDAAKEISDYVAELEGGESGEETSKEEKPIEEGDKKEEVEVEEKSEEENVEVEENKENL
jgi:pyruvate,water dikinase